MSPRPAKSADASYLHSASIQHWLQPTVANMLKAGRDQFIQVRLSEASSALSDVNRADLTIKRFAASQSFDALERRLIEHYRQAGPPTPRQNPDLFVLSPLTEALEHNWRQAQAMQALLEPVAKLIRLENEEWRSSTRDDTKRRYHPTIESYRRYMEPITQGFGETLRVLPEIHFDALNFQTHHQEIADAFRHFKQETESKDFKKRLEAHRRRAYNTQKSFQRYIDALIEAYSGLCVIYIDIGGGLATEQESPLSDVRNDFTKFLQKAANRTFSDQLVGYFWHLQKSPIRQYHYHCFFFFKPDQSDHLHDLQKQLCHLWIDDITHARGVAYQPFLPKELSQRHILLRPDQPSIHRQGDDTYNRLLTMVKALIQSDDVTRLEMPSGIRSNGRSQMPKALVQ